MSQSKATIVHVGYNVILTDDVLQTIRDRFPTGYDVEISTEHITAVFHKKRTYLIINSMSSEADKRDQISLADWFRVHSKKNHPAYLRAIYYQMNVSHDKEGVVKNVQAIFIAHVTIGSAHHYLNIFNNTGKRPIAVKADLSANGENYEVIEFEKTVELPVTVYKKEQEQ